MLFMGFKAQHLTLHGLKYKAQIYFNWPKYKAQIILNYSKQCIQLEDFSFMLHVFRSGLFIIGFGPEQIVGSPNRLRWTQSSAKLLIHHLTFVLFILGLRWLGSISLSPFSWKRYVLIYCNVLQSATYYCLFIHVTLPSETPFCKNMKIVKQMTYIQKME